MLDPAPFVSSSECGQPRCSMAWFAGLLSSTTLSALRRVGAQTEARCAENRRQQSGCRVGLPGPEPERGPQQAPYRKQPARDSRQLRAPVAASGSLTRVISPGCSAPYPSHEHQPPHAQAPALSGRQGSAIYRAIPIDKP